MGHLMPENAASTEHLSMAPRGEVSGSSVRMCSLSMTERCSYDNLLGVWGWHLSATPRELRRRFGVTTCYNAIPCCMYPLSTKWVTDLPSDTRRTRTLRSISAMVRLRVRVAPTPWSLVQDGGGDVRPAVDTGAPGQAPEAPVREWRCSSPTSPCSP